MRVTGDISVSLSVEEFIGFLTAADMATLDVQDQSCLSKTGSELLDIGDMLQVTSEDGSTVVYYSIQILISEVSNPLPSRINLYPNPNHGEVFTSGIKPGCRIRVLNTKGVIIRDQVVLGSNEIIQLKDQPPGTYFIHLMDPSEGLRIFKLILN